MLARQQLRRARKKNEPSGSLPLSNLFGRHPLFNNSNVVAETINIGGNRVPVNLLDDEELAAQAGKSNKASNERAARLAFGVMVFVLEAQVTAKASYGIAGQDASTSDVLALFVVIFGMLAAVTFAQMSSWLRRNFAVMRRHHHDNAIAIAELDLRRPPLSETRVPGLWAEFKRRYKEFFYE